MERMEKEKAVFGSRRLDLVGGPILRTLITLAMPIMVSSFLNTVYSITDMAWIGLLGSRAVAGVGVGGMFMWLAQGFGATARMGGQVMVGQSIGRGDRDAAVRYARGAVHLAILLAAVYAFVLVCFTGRLVSLFGLHDAVAEVSAVRYMKITAGCVILPYLTGVLGGIYTAQGDSRTPLLANFIGLAVNMFLDPMLILGVGPFPRLGVVGAACATVTAQFLSVLIMALRSRRDSANVLSGLRLLRPAGKSFYRHIVHIGVPASLQSMAYCLISMTLTRRIAVFGAAAVAVQNVGGNVESVSWNIADGFSSSMNAFCAQNYGAGKPDRIRRGYRIAFFAIFCWGLFITLLMELFPARIGGIFFHEADALLTAVPYFRIVGLSEALMCVEIMTTGALSGLGRTRLCSLISITLTAARIPLAAALSGTALGLSGVWTALAVTSIAKGVTFALAFRHVSGRLLAERTGR